MTTTWTQFGPDPMLTSLPSDMQNCLTTTPTPACDVIMGSAPSGQGHCANAMYAQTTYCSCVNNSMPCPQTTMAVCANTAYAYKPASWSVADANGVSTDENCRVANLCFNLVDVNGASNVVSSVNQSCGGGANQSSNKIIQVVSTNPILSFLLFFMIIVLLIVISIHTDDIENDILTKLNTRLDK